MGAGGNLGDDAAEDRVLVDLREDDVGDNARATVAAALDNRRRGLVATRFYAEDEHIAFRGSLPAAPCGQ